MRLHETTIYLAEQLDLLQSHNFERFLAVLSLRNRNKGGLIFLGQKCYLSFFFCYLSFVAEVVLVVAQVVVAVWEVVVVVAEVALVDDNDTVTGPVPDERGSDIESK